PGGEKINGYLNSTPNMTFRLEFFWHNHFGESIFLGFTNVTTNSQGTVTFTVQPISSNPMGPPSAPAGDPVTATATDPAGNTSEFSPEIRARFGADTAGRNPQTGQALAAQSTGIDFTSTHRNTCDPPVTRKDGRRRPFTGQ